MQSKVQQLQSILEQRIKLGQIERWSHVEVSLYDDTKEDYREKTLMQSWECLIRWNGNIRNGIHNEEFRTFPANHLDRVIARNQERLKNERTTYK